MFVFFSSHSISVLQKNYNRQTEQRESEWHWQLKCCQVEKLLIESAIEKNQEKSFLD